MYSSHILIILAIVVLIVTVAFVYLTVRKPKSGSYGSQSSGDGRLTNEFMASDFRSKKIKCTRCGGSAYGVLGTENVYRCSSCGFKSVTEDDAASGQHH